MLLFALFYSEYFILFLKIVFKKISFFKKYILKYNCENEDKLLDVCTINLTFDDGFSIVWSIILFFTFGVWDLYRRTVREFSNKFQENFKSYVHAKATFSHSAFPTIVFIGQSFWFSFLLFFISFSFPLILLFLVIPSTYDFSSGLTSRKNGANRSYLMEELYYFLIYSLLILSDH